MKGMLFLACLTGYQIATCNVYKSEHIKSCGYARDTSTLLLCLTPLAFAIQGLAEGSQLRGREGLRSICLD